MKRLLLAVGLLVLSRINRRIAGGVADGRTAEAASRSSPSAHTGRLGPDPRRELFVATVALGAAIAILGVPRLFRPPVQAVVATSTPKALRHVAVGGASDGTMRVTATTRTFGISSAGIATGPRPQHLALVVPVSGKACAALARTLGAGCGASAVRPLADSDLTVEAEGTLRLLLTSSAKQGFTMEGDGRFASLSTGAAQMHVRLVCGMPEQAIVMTFSGRRHTVSPACSADGSTVDMHLLLSYDTAPRVDLLDVSRLVARVPGRHASVRIRAPRLSVGDLADARLGSEPTAVSNVAVTASDTTVFALSSRWRGGSGLVRVSAPEIRSVRVSGHGEQVGSLYDKHSTVLFAVALTLVGSITITLLVNRLVRARPRSR